MLSPVLKRAENSWIKLMLFWIKSQEGWWFGGFASQVKKLYN